MYSQGLVGECQYIRTSFIVIPAKAGVQRYFCSTNVHNWGPYPLMVSQLNHRFNDYEPYPMIDQCGSFNEVKTNGFLNPGFKTRPVFPA